MRANIFLIALAAMSMRVDGDTHRIQVNIETSRGSIILELDSLKAPMTVANFLEYARSGFYDSTVFHRVIKGFMIQGGGLTQQMQPKQTRAPVRNEANNGLKNERGIVAMARQNEPHSATAQFFINTVNNAFLDYRESTSRGWGYCVFGRVIKGMDVVDAIETVTTATVGMYQNVPVDPVIIKSISVIEPEPEKKEISGKK